MKKLTKKQEQMKRSYYLALRYRPLNNIDECYEKPSIYKRRAEQWIFNQMREINTVDGVYAMNYTIIGYNCMSFSCAYEIHAYDNETGVIGNVLAIVYHTKDNQYVIPFDDTILEKVGFAL